MPYSTHNTSTVYLGGIAGHGGYSFSYCRSVYTAFSLVAEHERFKYADKLQIGGIQGAKPNYGGSYQNCYASIYRVWVSSVSGRYNPAAFYGLGPGSCYNGYSNSDIIFDTNITLSKKNEGNYSSSGMKGNAFLEELNNYAVEKLGHTVWTPEITLNKSNFSLETGQEEVLIATVHPDNATDKTVTWSSSNPNVATVDSNGKVTAKAKGSATITCKANDGSGVQATCEITARIEGIEINETNFPDANFRNYLLSDYYGGDGIITESEMSTITHLVLYDKDIKNLKGLEFFTALTYLGCSNNSLTSLDVSKNTALTHLYCSNNELTILDVSNNLNLQLLFCDRNKLSSLDFSAARNYIGAEFISEINMLKRKRLE